MNMDAPMYEAMSANDYDVSLGFGYATLTIPRASEIDPDLFAAMLPAMLAALADAHAGAFDADGDATEEHRYLFGSWLEAPHPLDVRVSLSAVTPEQLAGDLERIASRLLASHREARDERGTPQPARDVIAEASESYLEGMDPKRRSAIEAEARRLRARRLSIPFYADRERRRGARCWIMLALSYGGED